MHGEVAYRRWVKFLSPSPGAYRRGLVTAQHPKARNALAAPLRAGSRSTRTTKPSASSVRPVRDRRGDFDSAHVAVDRRDGDPKRLLSIAAAEDLGDLVRERLRDCQHARRD